MRTTEENRLYMAGWRKSNRPRARAINRLWKRRQSLLRAYRAAMQGGLHRAYVRAMRGVV
jgi:hypothetical protein